MQERGSALLTSVIIVMVLLAISGIFFTTIIYQAKNESSEDKGLKAYYLAEAGIQYGIAAGLKAIADGTLAKGGTLTLPPLTPPGQSGDFKVTVTNGTTSFTVTSTGEYLEDRRVKQAEYGYGGNGGDDCQEEDLNLNYPLWDPKAVYSIANTHVTYIDDNGNKRYFYNLWYADQNEIPGRDDVWQEITIKWRSFNRYELDAVNIVCYQGKKFKVTQSNWSENQQPGLLNNPWNEITYEWRNFNVYHAAGDYVTYNSQLFRSRWYTYNQQPGLIGSPWQELTNDWANANDYNAGDIVVYNGELYRAHDNGNADFKQPGLDSSWQQLTTEWKSFNIYDPGDDNTYNDVVYNGHWYRANYYNKNKIPGTSNAWYLLSSQPADPVLLGVMISPMTASVTVGQKQTYTAKAIYSDGSTKDVTNSATWSSSNSSYATVDHNVATGLSADAVTGTIRESTPISIPIPKTVPITAIYRGKVGNGYITVNPPASNSGTGGTNGKGLLWEKETILNN
ncbi:type II secretory pathway, component PulK [Desulfosporosinus acidiphilus SJ4]|uniref:Type II secretory pathway, component PulK n=1 Tax=Desulfosporosinus acidiphilus (strain DSM 22704 / JCM 16185 / SJ4) TaxID=646529 RepID=I4D949_DESAJ|nr:Ig-like domain-containing protein [Desulfosporosinus acidiphilus]AFM42323.1 type II secretory pathway, component PulK [Desulfosporosinus acidiphilus SJ4]